MDATSRRCREASFEERTGWSLTRQVSECVLNTACERPPFLMAAPYRLMFRAIALTLRAGLRGGSARRLRRFGGFATFSQWRSHPSSVRRGVRLHRTFRCGEAALSSFCSVLFCSVLFCSVLFCSAKPEGGEFRAMYRLDLARPKFSSVPNFANHARNG